MPDISNFQRTANFLAACGKTPHDVTDLSVQIGCHLEEMAEFLQPLLDCDTDFCCWEKLYEANQALLYVSHCLKKQLATLQIPNDTRVQTQMLDAICDMEVTGNGVAHLAGMDKECADMAVLESNDAKLVDGKPVILEGGKIGKPEGWIAPDLALHLIKQWD